MFFDAIDTLHLNSVILLYPTLELQRSDPQTSIPAFRILQLKSPNQMHQAIEQNALTSGIPIFSLHVRLK